MKGLGWFLAISFVPAWITWEIAIRSGVDVSSWRMALFLLPGAFCPALATFVVRRWITHEGFDDLKLPMVHRRWTLYVTAWLLPLAVIGAMIAEAAALGLGAPDFSLARAVADQTENRDIGMSKGLGFWIVPLALLTALAATPILFGEEFGWRGYLQRRLFPGRPVAAAIGTGAIWGVWHYPLTLRGYNYPDEPLLGTALFTVFTMLISYIFGWFYRRSRSIWCASLAHAATNSVGGTLSLLWFAGMGGPIVTSYVGLLALPPLGAVAVALALIDRHEQGAATTP